MSLFRRILAAAGLVLEVDGLKVTGGAPGQVLVCGADGVFTGGGADGGFVAGPAGSAAAFKGPSAIGDAVAAAAAAILAGTIPSAVVQVLPGSYSGSFDLPANVSIVAAGGLGSVTFTGDITLTGTSGFNNLSGVNQTGSIVGNTGGAASSAIVVIRQWMATAATGGYPALGALTSGWTFDVSGGTFDGSGTTSSGYGEGAACSLTAYNVSFKGAASKPAVEAWGAPTLSQCVLAGGSGVKLDASVTATLTDTRALLSGSPSSVHVGVAGAVFSFAGWTQHTGLAATGSLVSGGASVTNTPGAFLGAYQTAHLPTPAAGATAFDTTTNRWTTYTGGAWV